MDLINLLEVMLLGELSGYLIKLYDGIIFNRNAFNYNWFFLLPIV